MALLWLLLAIVFVAATAARYGADSRDGRDWQRAATVRPERLPVRRHTPSSDLRAVLRAMSGRPAGADEPSRAPRYPYADPAYPSARYLDPPPADPRWAPPNGRAGGSNR